MANNGPKILGINTKFREGKFPNLVEEMTTSHVSFMDYDFVIIDSQYITSCYDVLDETYKNKDVLTADSSYQINTDFALIKEQLVNFLKCGRNVYVLIGENDTCYGQIYHDFIMGCDRPARFRDEYGIFDTYSFLPLNISPIHITGQNMNICCGHPFSEFFQETMKYSYYEGYFVLDNFTPLLKVPDTNNVVSASVKIHDGYVIFLPQPFSDEVFESGNEDKIIRKYLNALCKLNKSLSSSPTELPDWASDIQILNEAEVLIEIQNKKRELELLQATLEKTEKKLADIQKYKALVTESGSQLEAIVSEVLRKLGFKLKETVTGRSDVIAYYNSRGIVVEIKGLTGSAAEKHAAQLEKWVSEFIEDTKKVPKALLIVNAFSQIPISKRKTKKVFPDQMLRYCRAREQCLISTTQLLCLFIDIQNNPETKEEKICELLDTVGVYEKYTNVEEFLRPVKIEGY